MRFKKVKEEKVMSSFSFGIAKSHVGNGHSANTLFQKESRAVSGKIEKMTRFSESGQFLSPPLGFQFVQDQRPNIIHIYPGPKDCKDIGVVQFRYRFFYLKSTHSHFFIPPVTILYIN